MSSTQVEGLQAYTDVLSANKGKDIFALFTGTPDKSGKSWCPDCVTADPVIESCLKDLPSGAIFIKCLVGDRPKWKDPKCEFRTHPSLLLKSVPTLIKVGSKERLAEAQCANTELVNMLFTDS